MKSVGRPRNFETVEELEGSIEEYLNDNSVEDYTITGLALHLGFESRQSFYDYKDMEEFSYTMKRARLYIENSYESCLKGNSVTGSIFALKNMGWTDKSEVENINKNITVDLKDEDLDEQIKKLQGE